MTVTIRTNSTIVVFATIAVMTLSRPSHAQYIGDAYGLKLNVLSLGVVSVADTGPLPSAGGGPFTVHLLNAGVGSSAAGLGATTGVIDTSTQGLGGVATSFAVVNNLNVLPPLGTSLQLSATVVRSDASASSGGTVGSSTITGLVFGSNSITVTGAPNQTVLDAFGDTLIINEQLHNPDGSLTVNALDLSVINSTATLRVSSATAGFAGGAVTPEPGSFALLAGIIVSGGLFTVRRSRKSVVR